MMIELNDGYAVSRISIVNEIDILLIKAVLGFALI